MKNKFEISYQKLATLALLPWLNSDGYMIRPIVALIKLFIIFCWVYTNMQRQRLEALYNISSINDTTPCCNQKQASKINYTSFCG